MKLIPVSVTVKSEMVEAFKAATVENARNTRYGNQVIYALMCWPIG